MVSVLMLSPGQRIGLGIAEALHRLEHSFLVAQARILDAAERRHLQTITRHLAHIDAADVEFPHEAGDEVEAVGAQCRREAVGRAVGYADRLFYGLEADHR